MSEKLLIKFNDDLMMKLIDLATTELIEVINGEEYLTPKERARHNRIVKVIDALAKCINNDPDYDWADKIQFDYEEGMFYGS